MRLWWLLGLLVPLAWADRRPYYTSKNPNLFNIGGVLSGNTSAAHFEKIIAVSPSAFSIIALFPLLLCGRNDKKMNAFEN
jgi:hypothetical protein